MSGTLKPLRLRWTLATPMVVGAHPLHLDALVAFAMTEVALRNSPVANPSFAELAKDLPLGRAEEGALWCWQASALSVDTASHAMRYWTRKTDTDDYSARVAAGQIEGRFKFPLKAFAYKIDTQRGLFKQQFKFFPVKQVHTVTAWCIGDEELLGNLLDPNAGLVTHLGGKARMGMGKIASFEIVHDEEAHHRWTRRVLPWPHEESVPVRMAVRPPYWDIANISDAYVNPSIL